MTKLTGVCQQYNRRTSIKQTRQLVGRDLVPHRSCQSSAGKRTHWRGLALNYDATTQPGLIDIRVTAIDQDGFSSTQVQTVRVKDPLDTSAPAISWAGSLAGSTLAKAPVSVQSLTSVQASLQELQLMGYQLQIAPAGTNSWTTLAQQSTLATTVVPRVTVVPVVPRGRSQGQRSQGLPRVKGLPRVRVFPVPRVTVRVTVPRVRSPILQNPPHWFSLPVWSDPCALNTPVPCTTSLHAVTDASPSPKTILTGLRFCRLQVMRLNGSTRMPGRTA